MPRRRRCRSASTCPGDGGGSTGVLSATVRDFRLYDAGDPTTVPDFENYPHIDPATGRETIVFTCFNQDQHLDQVDFPNLAARLRQNTVQEKLSSMWLDHLLLQQELAHV